MFRRFLGFSLLVAWPSLALAQPLADRVPLLGRAIDSSGQPLAGVLISVRRQEESGAHAFWGASAATGARGEFRFPGAEAGRYYISAESPGFAPISNRSLTWTADAAPLDLKLQRLVRLRLSVTRPDGSPAANAPFWVRLRGNGDAAQVTSRLRSDGAGQVEVASLAPATYSVFLTAPDGYARASEVNLRADATQKLALQPGGSLRATVRESGTDSRFVGGAILSLLPASTGTPRAPGPAPIEDAAFLAASGQRLDLFSRDGDGQIALDGVPPGRYTARLSVPGAASPPPQSVEIVAGASCALSWLVARAPGAPLTLQLNEPDGQIAAPGEATLRLLPINDDGTLRSAELSDDAPFVPGDNGRRAVIEASGKITVFPLAPGRYRVFVARRQTQPDAGPSEAASLDVSIPPEGATASLVLKAAP